MLRIDTVTGVGATRILRLEGEVVGPWVDALGRSCDAELSTHDGVILDLQNVVFVDRDGVALFHRLVQAGAVVVNGSAFVRSQIGV